jgi:hypothetical protein
MFEEEYSDLLYNYIHTAHFKNVLFYGGYSSHMQCEWRTVPTPACFRYIMHDTMRS